MLKYISKPRIFFSRIKTKLLLRLSVAVNVGLVIWILGWLPVWELRPVCEDWNRSYSMMPVYSIIFTYLYPSHAIAFFPSIIYAYFPPLFSSSPLYFVEGEYNTHFIQQYAAYLGNYGYGWIKYHIRQENGEEVTTARLYVPLRALIEWEWNWNMTTKVVREYIKEQYGQETWDDLWDRKVWLSGYNSVSGSTCKAIANFALREGKWRYNMPKPQPCPPDPKNPEETVCPRE